ncbi:caffeoyl-CoA O-methyltransferase-like protein [Tanacetum coccineum]
MVNLSSYEAYQGGFVVMVQDLDVTPRTQGSGQEPQVASLNDSVLDDPLWSFHGLLLGSFGCGYWVIMSSDRADTPKIGGVDMDILMMQGGFNSHAASFTTVGTPYLRNQRENIVLSIANAQSRLGIPVESDPTIDERAVTEVFLKVLDNYIKWCKYLRKRVVWGSWMLLGFGRRARPAALSWSPACFELSWPMKKKSPFLRWPKKTKRTGKSTFVEHRTFLHLYRSFHHCLDVLLMFGAYSTARGMVISRFVIRIVSVLNSAAKDIAGIVWLKAVQPGDAQQQTPRSWPQQSPSKVMRFIVHLDTKVYPESREARIHERSYVKSLAKHPWNLMTTSADEGQFLNLLLKLINAKNTMEIGVYTGYSLLSTALALPEDGKILALDINRENYEIGLPIIEKAGVAHKIDFREGPALPLLDQMVDDVTFHGSFDFIFVDADKDNYLNYHKRLIDLVKIGGVIGYDNTLWNGSLVAPPDAPLRKYVRYYRDFVLELNKALAADSRVEICQLPVGDGITLCRRIS